MTKRENKREMSFLRKQEFKGSYESGEIDKRTGFLFKALRNDSYGES